MRNLFLFFFLLAVACNDQTTAGPTSTTKDQPDTPALATRRVEILDPEANQFFDSTTTVDVIGGGFLWTEGPLYIKDGDYFLFSDVIGNRIYKWKEGDSIKLYLEPSGYLGTQKGKKEPGSNGLLLDANGRLVLCQHGERRLARMKAPVNDPKPFYEVLANHFEGKRFNSPNDAVFHPNGDLYFTDPPYGLDHGVQDSTKELDFSGVYRLTPKGHVDLLTKELPFPNGIALSPDGKFLFVASSDGKNMIWMKYELNEQGLIKNKQLFYEVHRYEGKNMGGPDGMKMSRKGYLFASGPQGIWVFNPQAKPIARLYTGEATSNCAFSADEKTLLLTCDDYVMRVKLK
jgi:gluconolactonase